MHACVYLKNYSLFINWVILHTLFYNLTFSVKTCPGALSTSVHRGSGSFLSSASMRPIEWCRQQSMKLSVEPFRPWGVVWLHRSHARSASPDWDNEAERRQCPWVCLQPRPGRSRQALFCPGSEHTPFITHAACGQPVWSPTSGRLCSQATQGRSCSHTGNNLQG